MPRTGTSGRKHCQLGKELVELQQGYIDLIAFLVKILHESMADKCKNARS